MLILIIDDKILNIAPCLPYTHNWYAFRFTDQRYNLHVTILITLSEICIYFCLKYFEFNLTRIRLLLNPASFDIFGLRRSSLKAIFHRTRNWIIKFFTWPFIVSLALNVRVVVYMFVKCNVRHLYIISFDPAL